jgi:hypothetical protein
MPVMKCFGPFPDQLGPSVITQSQQSPAVFISSSEIRAVVMKLMFKTGNQPSGNISVVGLHIKKGKVPVLN